MQAGTKISREIKRNTGAYYELSMLYAGSGIFIPIIGRKISKNSAITRLRRGQSTITYWRSNAYSIAKKAGGGRTPVSDPAHKNCMGYFRHYHLFDRKNKGHSAYLG